MKIKVKLLNNAKAPEYKTDGASCLDCYAYKDVDINPMCTELVPLGFALQLNKNYEAQIRPRSGLSKQGINCLLGTIDSDYRGQVSAIIQNNTDKIYSVKKDDRICQMFIGKTKRVEITIAKELNTTVRGDGGFGSTGK